MKAATTGAEGEPEPEPDGDATGTERIVPEGVRAQLAHGFVAAGFAHPALNVAFEPRGQFGGHTQTYEYTLPSFMQLYSHASGMTGRGHAVRATSSLSNFCK